MTGREYLSQYKLMQGTVDRLESDLRIEQAKRDAISINMDGMPHGTDISRRTENIAIKIVDLEQEIKESIDEAKALQNEIKLVIEGVGKGLSKPWKWSGVREVLTAMYLNEYPRDRKSRHKPTTYNVLEDVLPFSRGTIEKYHNMGIEEVERRLNE